MTENLTRNLEPVDDAESEPVAQGRNVIAVIGIDAYTRWPKLNNAVSDALGVQKLFIEKLGFVMPLPPLLNADATADKIMALVTDQLPQVLQPDDNLVLFFAGHGHTRINKVALREIESGYLVPVDAQLENWADKLSTDYFLENVSQLPARHVLLVIDACKSGFALSGMSVHRSAVTYQEKLARNVSRQVITSARRNEDALDSGPIPKHSLFTGTLIEGLNWGAADLDRNGLVTSYELGLYLQQRVGQASDSKQTPDFGSFNLDERGELVISLRDDTFDAVKARGFAAMLNHDAAKLQELVKQLLLLRPTAAETVYLGFRLKFMQGAYDEAMELVAQLNNMPFDDGVIPLTKAEVDALLVQLGYWKQLLQIPPTTLPLRVELQVESLMQQFETAPLAAFSGGEAYQIGNGAVARYRVENTSAARAHLYFLTITPHGRMVVGPLLEGDEARIEGLAPGAVGFGQRFQINGLPSIVENRILYSPERVSELLFPAMVAARAPNLWLGVNVPTRDPSKIAALQMQPLFYQIVSHDLTLPADAEAIRNAYSRLILTVENMDIILPKNWGDTDATVLA
ncbi:MAG: caspase family protein [Chloroflexi bacterium]|nr:caspase family protein [Chloroflexota bacterium]